MLGTIFREDPFSEMDCRGFFQREVSTATKTSSMRYFLKTPRIPVLLSNSQGFLHPAVSWRILRHAASFSGD